MSLFYTGTELTLGIAASGSVSGGVPSTFKGHEARLGGTVIRCFSRTIRDSSNLPILVEWGVAANHGTWSLRYVMGSYVPGVEAPNIPADFGASFEIARSMTIAQTYDDITGEISSVLRSGIETIAWDGGEPQVLWYAPYAGPGFMTVPDLVTNGHIYMSASVNISFFGVEQKASISASYTSGLTGTPPTPPGFTLHNCSLIGNEVSAVVGLGETRASFSVRYCPTFDITFTNQLVGIPNQQAMTRNFRFACTRRSPDPLDFYEENTNVSSYTHTETFGGEVVSCGGYGSWSIPTPPFSASDSFSYSNGETYIPLPQSASVTFPVGETNGTPIPLAQVNWNKSVPAIYLEQLPAMSLCDLPGGVFLSPSGSGAGIGGDSGTFTSWVDTIGAVGYRYLRIRYRGAGVFTITVDPGFISHSITSTGDSVQEMVFDLLETPGVSYDPQLILTNLILAAVSGTVEILSFEGIVLTGQRVRSLSTKRLNQSDRFRREWNDPRTWSNPYLTCFTDGVRSGQQYSTVSSGGGTIYSSSLRNLVNEINGVDGFSYPSTYPRYVPAGTPPKWPNTWGWRASLLLPVVPKSYGAVPIRPENELWDGDIKTETLHGDGILGGSFCISEDASAGITLRAQYSMRTFSVQGFAPMPFHCNGAQMPSEFPLTQTVAFVTILGGGIQGQILFPRPALAVEEVVVAGSGVTPLEVARLVRGATSLALTDAPLRGDYDSNHHVVGMTIGTVVNRIQNGDVPVTAYSTPETRELEYLRLWGSESTLSVNPAICVHPHLGIPVIVRTEVEDPEADPVVLQAVVMTAKSNIPVSGMGFYSPAEIVLPDPWDARIAIPVWVTDRLFVIVEAWSGGDSAFPRRIYLLYSDDDGKSLSSDILLLKEGQVESPCIAQAPNLNETLISWIEVASSGDSYGKLITRHRTGGESWSAEFEARLISPDTETDLGLLELERLGYGMAKGTHGSDPWILHAVRRGRTGTSVLVSYDSGKHWSVSIDF